MTSLASSRILNGMAVYNGPVQILVGDELCPTSPADRRRYGFIFIPDRSFGHIHDKTLAAECLQRMYDHLTPGGLLDAGSVRKRTA